MNRRLFLSLVREGAGQRCPLRSFFLSRSPMVFHRLASLALASTSLLLPAVDWFLILLISPTSKPGGSGRAGFIRGCRASLPSYIPSEEYGKVGSCGVWKPHVWPSFVRLSCQLCSQSPPSQSGCCFMLVPGLVQTLGELPSTASAGRHCVPF